MAEMIDGDNFRVEIEDGLVLVNFWAPWVGICRAFNRTLEEVEREVEKKVKFYWLNVDDNDVVSKECDIKIIPSVIIFKDGIEVARKAGFIKKEVLTKTIREQIEKGS